MSVMDGVFDDIAEISIKKAIDKLAEKIIYTEFNDVSKAINNELRTKCRELLENDPEIKKHLRKTILNVLERQYKE